MGPYTPKPTRIHSRPSIHPWVHPPQTHHPATRKPSCSLIHPWVHTPIPTIQLQEHPPVNLSTHGSTHPNPPPSYKNTLLLLYTPMGPPTHTHHPATRTPSCPFIYPWLHTPKPTTQLQEHPPVNLSIHGSTHLKPTTHLQEHPPVNLSTHGSTHLKPTHQATRTPSC